MKKISKKAVNIVEKYDNFNDIPFKEWIYVVEQIEKLYLDFFAHIFSAGLHVRSITITDIELEEHQGIVIQAESPFMGTCCFPTEDGRYLVVDYSCQGRSYDK